MAPTIQQMLDQILDYNRRSTALVLTLKGEAPAEEPAPPAPVAPPSKFVNGMSAPDEFGRVELELIERLIAEFGPAPNGYKIPKLWIVPGVVVSHLPPSVQGDYQMNVGGAGFNLGVAYTYRDETGWLGKKMRVKDGALPGTLCWNGSLADLDAALRYRISTLLNPNQSDPYTPEPNNGALDTVAGYIDLKLPGN